MCALPEDDQKVEIGHPFNFKQMIVNCPIYIEVDLKFNPQDGKEFTMYMRKFISDWVAKESGGAFRFQTSEGKPVRVKILSETEVIRRFGNAITPEKTNPPKGEK